jgi:hypothetical protein
VPRVWRARLTRRESLLLGSALRFLRLLPLDVGAILGTSSAFVATLLALVTRMLLMQVGGLLVQLRGTFMSFPRPDVRIA